MNNIETLLKAARYIEKRERGQLAPPTGDRARQRPPSAAPRAPPIPTWAAAAAAASDDDDDDAAVAEAEAEHGYASTRCPDDLLLRTASKRPKKKSQGNRTSHNELEKNRRAHLKNCLDKLKDIVPLGPEASKHTTLGLLTKAKRFIKNLEDKERKHSSYKDQLSRDNRYLKRRYEQLSTLHYAMSKRRSVSECSSSTVSSSHSTTSSHSSAPSPISESDEVDVIGYTSTQSDTDDHSSVQSASSDSGVAMSTSRLTLSEMDVL